MDISKTLKSVFATLRFSFTPLASLASLFSFAILFFLTSAKASVSRDREQAIEIFNQVLENPKAPGWMIPVAEAAREQLKTARFLPGHPLICLTAQAYVAPGDDSAIHLCEMYFTQTQEGRVQILMHEAFHLAGESDECQATWNEILMLKLLRKKSSANTSYFYQCGIDEHNGTPRTGPMDPEKEKPEDDWGSPFGDSVAALFNTL
jgi:hypothetical protein